MGDIVIIGGGVIGSSTAYHLALAGLADRVKVIEPDPTYERAATPKSVGGVRVQFSIPTNIEMSRFGHEFYGDFETRMAIDGEPAHIDFRHYGYLFVAETAAELAVLEEVNRVQVAQGADVRMLDRAGVKEACPPLEVDTVVGASFSPGDGFIDPHAALMGFRRKAVSLGIEYVRDRAVDLEVSDDLVRTVTLESGRQLAADHVINAANCWAPQICELVGMKVPVEPMRRHNFYFECQTDVGIVPLTRYIGKGGSFRTEGAGYLSGISVYDEPRGFNWDIDYSLFEETLWPLLAERVKAFEAVKLRQAWACHYDQNHLDANHIIGAWPGRLENFLIACGLSGHGLQHAPAIGRGLAELVVHRRYETIDMGCFGYQRILDDAPIFERGVIA